MNRRKFLQSMAVGTTVAFTGSLSHLVLSDPVIKSLKLETDAAFLLTDSNPHFKERIKNASYVHKLTDSQWLVWGEDPSHFSLEEISQRQNKP